MDAETKRKTIREAKRLLALAQKDTLPEIPWKIRWKSRFFGNETVVNYLWDYYTGEAEGRIPFYLPYIYRREGYDYLRRSAGLAKKEVTLILIDNGDARTDYLLCEFLEELNYLTIVTERREYFSGFADRAFQELGLLVDLYLPWQAKQLNGNLVWDLTAAVQTPGCYPEGSVCLIPHKTRQQKQELESLCRKCTFLMLQSCRSSGTLIPASLAETLLVPPYLPFRAGRCEMLKEKCIFQGIEPIWSV